MKKTLYTITFILSALGAQAQTPIKETREEVADVVLFGPELLLTTRKDPDGQYIYVERLRQPGAMVKDTVLNAGHTNAVIGSNQATGELFVYHRQGRRRRDERIGVYRWQQGAFEQVEARPVPRRMNHSPHLGLFLSGDKGTLYISAEYRPGGRGYEDLYVSRWEGGRWTRPKGLGREVNTRQAEFAPFVAGDSLFFSRKEGEAAYVYGIPLQENAKPAGQAQKLEAKVNQEQAFNAYYKKSEAGELWITAATAGQGEEGQLTAFVSEKAAPVVVEAAAPAPVVEAAVPAAVAEAKEKVVPAGELELRYGFNQVFLQGRELRRLQAFLSRQPQGAALTITGFSDAVGSEQARQRVSRKRAAFVKWYIERYYPGRGFEVTAAVGEVEGQSRKVRIDKK